MPDGSNSKEGLSGSVSFRGVLSSGAVAGEGDGVSVLSGFLWGWEEEEAGGGERQTEVDESKIFYLLRVKCRCPIFQQ